MSQGALALPLVGVYGGLAAAADINNALDALLTKNSGSSPPTNAGGGVPELGQDWLDTTVALLPVWKVYAGAAGWLAIGTFDIANSVWLPAQLAGLGTLPSAASMDLGSVAQSGISVTGSTGPIAALGSSAPLGAIKTLSFVSTPTITNSGAIVCVGGQNIVVEAGDVAAVMYLGSGNWRMLYYSRASGAPLTPLWGYLAELVKTGDYTVATTDRGLLIVANKASALTFTLPAAAGASKTLLHFKNIGAGDLTIDGNASELIDLGLQLVLNTNQAATLEINGTQSRVLSFYRGYPASTVALVDGATPALDASQGDTFILTAAGNRTIAVPTNPTNGQRIEIRHIASGGARTLALNTGAGGFRFGSDITGLTATASGKTDYIGAVYNAAANAWDVLAYTKGF